MPHAFDVSDDFQVCRPSGTGTPHSGYVFCISIKYIFNEIPRNLKIISFHGYPLTQRLLDKTRNIFHTQCIQAVCIYPNYPSESMLHVQYTVNKENMFWIFSFLLSLFFVFFLSHSIFLSAHILSTVNLILSNL